MLHKKFVQDKHLKSGKGSVSKKCVFMLKVI